MYALTNDELKLFENQGYVGPFDLPQKALDDFGDLETITEVLNGELPQDARRNQHVCSRSLDQLATHPAILERLKSILGEDIVLWVAHVLSRPPNDPGQIWHSDTINQFLRGVHVSIAITDMTKANGCMKLVKGSHLYRASLSAAIEFGLIDGKNDQMLLEYADKLAPWHAPHSIEHIELGKGQFFFTWGGLWHGIGPNFTSANRLACVARFARTDVTCKNYGFKDYNIVEGPKLPCILVSGIDKFGFNKMYELPNIDIFRR
jgi:non-haem Fe2+, alpha-ketoglutarate-dependent halogenase